MDEPPPARAARARISRLLIGATALPLLLAVTTVDALTRDDGYSMTHHWISLLALGPRGWLGTTTLAVCGLMAAANAPAFVPRRTGTEQDPAEISAIATHNNSCSRHRQR